MAAKNNRNCLRPISTPSPAQTDPTSRPLPDHVIIHSRRFIVKLIDPCPLGLAGVFEPVPHDANGERAIVISRSVPPAKRRQFLQRITRSYRQQLHRIEGRAA